MKTKVLVNSALFGATFLAASIYLHLAGKAQLTITGIIAICIAAPVAGLAMWFRQDWVPKKIQEMSDGSTRDRNQP